MFHSHTTTTKAKSILNDLTTIGGCLRVVVSTVALRPNIFIHVQHVVEQYDEVLSWILHKVKEKGTDAKKTILYNPSINTCQKDL